MAAEPGLISLLHHADWTRLSLSAEVSDGTTLLLAPGKRYRQQEGEFVRGSDGDRIWELYPGSGEGREANESSVHLVGRPGPPLRALLSPAWLLRSSTLEVRGRARACGRDALHVMVTRRPGAQGRAASAHRGAGRIEALVDARLGILARLARLGDDQPDVTELVSLDLDPVIGPAQFTPPPGDFTDVLGASIPPQPAGVVLKAAGAVTRQAATEAAKAARNVLRWLDTR